MDNNPFDAVVAQQPEASDNPFDSVVGNTPAPAAPAANPFDQVVVDGAKNRERQQFLETLRNSKDIVPERQAQAIEIANLRGVPVGVAYKHLEDMQPKPVAADYDSMTHKAPATARLLADPVKGPVAFPDAQPLADIEQNLAAFTLARKGEGQWQGPPEPPLSLREQVYGRGSEVLTPEQQDAEQKRILRQRADEAKAIIAHEQQLEADRKAREAVDPMFKRDFGGANYNPNTDLQLNADKRASTETVNKFANALDNKPTLTDTGAMFDAFGAGVGSSLNVPGYAGSMADWIKTLVNPNDPNAGQGNFATKWGEAWSKGVAELFPGDKVKADQLNVQFLGAVGTMLPIIAAAWGSGGTTALMGGTAGEIAGTSATTAALMGSSAQVEQAKQEMAGFKLTPVQKAIYGLGNAAIGLLDAIPAEKLLGLAEETGGRGFARILAGAMKQVGVEGPTEGGQQLLQDTLAKYLFDPTRDVIGNALNATLVGGLAGGFFGTTHMLANSAAEANHQRLLALGEAARKTRLADLSRTIHDETIAQMPGLERVTAPVKAVLTLFQELSTSDIIEQFPQTAKSLQEAQQHQGGDENASAVEVTIPAPELVRLAKLKGYNNFTTDVRVGDDLTFNEKMDQTRQLVTELGKMDTSEPAKVQEDSPLFQGIRDQLVAAGQSREAATTQARLFDAVLTNMADRTGIPVADLARRHGVEISNTAIDAAGQTTLAQDTSSPAFNEPAIRVDGQVMKASDVFPNWPKGSRPAGGDGMSIADEQAMGDVNLGPGMPEDPFWGHADLRQLAAERFGAEHVNQQIESDPENGFGFVNDKGEFKSLKALRTTTLNQATADGTNNTEAGTENAEAGTENADTVLAEDTTPDVAPAVEAASLDAANTLSKSRAWEKGRDLKVAMQNAVLGVLQKLGLDPVVRSGASLHYLTTVGLKDALVALEQNPNAIGWYDVKTRQALAVMALVHPEILKDENARFAFTWALAVTSNGIKVGKNFELADKVYTRFKKDGVMPSDIKAGNAQDAINDSLHLFNILRERWGIDNLRKFMLTDFTVKEITGIDPELKPSGEAIDELVRGAAVLGPKIGNGFFSNLYGNFDALTMDRWLVRTWGRWTGTLIELDEPNIARSRTRLRQALKGLDRQALADALRALTKETKTKGDTELKPGDREALIQALRTLEYGRGKGVLEASADTNVDELAFAVNRASQEPKFRTAMNAVAGGEELRLAGNSLAKYLDGQKEQPGGKRLSGPNERRYIREVFNNILATLKQDPRYAELKMADLQAVLWYAEKRLYETAKEDTVVQGGDVAGGDVSGYEDDDAPDYANAAAKRARENGVSDRKINAALKREAENGRPEAARPGDAGTGTADGTAGAGAAGGQQVPARGFARDEKRSFIQREALDRVRSNRVVDAEQSWSYARGSGADGARPRLLKALGVTYVAEWKAGGNLATVFRANGINTPTILELEPGSAKNAARFVSAISTARDTLGPIGEAVKVYSPEEYAGMRLFVTKDGQSGFALKPDGDIVSVFSAKGTGNGRAVMETAIAAGGKKLDCFATILPDFYAAHGFRATSRLLWNDEIAMADMPAWDKAAMAKFNNGEPDVVFMVYDPSFNGEYDRKGTPLKSGDNGYDLAVKAQDRAMRAVERAAASQAGEPPSGGSSASRTTLNQGGKQDIRGAITFTPLRDKFHITLTEKANLSTFIHEGGHFFLEVLQDLVQRGEASAQQVADLKTLKRWMGIDDAALVDRNGHEKFARTWEQYLMEGKAPSLALHGIFQKFKAWMIFVYKRLANVRGELNDEIRTVMDRLVASDAAIAEARTMVGWRGEAMSQEETGLTDDEYKAYVGQWMKANDAQSADADARIMLEAARELKKTWADEKTKVTKELEAALAETRGWKAWKLLQDGEGLDELGRTVMKIDPDSIPKEWRAGTAGMTAPADQGGQDLDVVAEQLGFDTGEQMLQLIGGAKLAQKAIPARVRQIMVERHGEMDAAALSQEAMKAVHNTPTMDVLLTEFRALAAKANLKIGKDTHRLVKAAAEERVAQAQVRKLEPSKWRRAEVKAAEEAGKLAAKGKDMEAALAKRRQLMAAAMAKASLEAQDRASAIKDYLDTFTTNRRRAALGKAGDTYLDQVDQILEAVQLKEVSLKAIKARQGLDEFVKEQEAAGEPVFISSATRDLLGRKNYTEMSLEELEGIHDAVKNLWTVAKEINTVRREGEKIALENALAEIEKETESLLPVKGQRAHLPNMKTKVDKARELLAKYHAGNLKMEFVLDWMGKTAHSLIYQPIADAYRKSWELHRDLTAPFMDKLRTMPKEQKRRWNTKREFLNYPGGPLKGANIWTIALNLGNEGNKAKMLAGYGWTEQQVMAELATFMTKEDWDLAQETWDTIDKMWPRMAEVVKRATGLTPPKVEATPIVTPFGTYRGGYFPVVYDTVLDSRMDDKLDSSISPEEMFSKRFTAFVINNGFTKGRTANTGKLLFDPDIIAQHMGEVIHYATHYDAVKQADKIIRSPVFKSLVKTHMGDPVYAELKQWLKDVATNTTRADRTQQAGDRALRWARNSAQLTSLGLNIKSALKQPLGIITTLDALKTKHWMIGIQKAWLSPSAVTNWKEAFAKSKELGPLIKNYDRDVAVAARAYADSIGDRARSRVYELAFMPISVMQSVANVAAWHGAYSQALEQKMSEGDAINFADKIVRTTQGSGALKDLSGMQRGGEANKFFTMFYSYFGVLYNRLADVQVREAGLKNLHRKVGRYTVLLLMGELLNTLGDDAWSALFPPDKKKEEDTTPFLVRLALNTVDSTINTLPVVRDLYTGANAALVGTPSRPPPALGGVVKAFQGIGAARAIIWDGKDMTRAKARNIAALAGILTNQPVYGVYKMIDDIFAAAGHPIFEK